MNTITTSELRRRMRDVLSGLRQAAQPYFVLQYSRPVAVLLDISDYEHLQAQAGNPHPQIVRRPGISGGEPILSGTRISVREIVERIRAGQTIEDIADNLPPLTPSLVLDALSYYYDYPDDIEQLISENQVSLVLAKARLKAEKVAPGIVRARPRSEPSA
jgi:prevent-host-death family protein